MSKLILSGRLTERVDVLMRGHDVSFRGHSDPVRHGEWNIVHRIHVSPATENSALADKSIVRLPLPSPHFIMSGPSTTHSSGRNMSPSLARARALLESGLFDETTAQIDELVQQMAADRTTVHKKQRSSSMCQRYRELVVKYEGVCEGAIPEGQR